MEPLAQRARDCSIPTATSEATATIPQPCQQRHINREQRNKGAQARPRRRLLYINSNQRRNSQYDSRVINRCITATAICDYRRRLARQQRPRIRVGHSCMLATTRKGKAFLAQLYINSDQQSENISGTAVPMMVAYPHSRVSDGCISTLIPALIPTASRKAKASGTAVPVITVYQYQQRSAHQPQLCNHRHQRNMQLPLIKLQQHELYINSKEQYSGRNSDPCQP